MCIIFKCPSIYKLASFKKNPIEMSATTAAAAGDDDDDVSQ